MTWEEVLSRIRQRYEGPVEIDEQGEDPVLLVGKEDPIPIPNELYRLPVDEVPPGFRQYLCQKLPQLHPTDLGLDWPRADA